MKISENIEQDIKNEIRKQRVLHPTISVRQLRINLAKKGFTSAMGGPLHLNYINRLIRKLQGELIYKANKQLLSERIATVRERFQIIFEQLHKIAHWDWEYLDEGIQMPSSKERVSAMHTLMQMDLGLFHAELDAGIFQKIGDNPDNEKEDDISSELMDKIVNAFTVGTSKTSKPVLMVEAKAKDLSVNQTDESNTKPKSATESGKPIGKKSTNPGRVVKFNGQAVVVKSTPSIDD